MIRILAALLLASPALAQTGYDKMVILAIGISDYEHGISAAEGCLKSKTKWCDLPNGHVDAYRFASVFEQGGFMTAPEVILLPEAESHRAGILAAIDRAAAKAETGSRALFVLYFTGHGETKGETGYLVPRDGSRDVRNSWISMDALRGKLASYSGIRHQLVLLGSCFSGAVFRSAESESLDQIRRGSPATVSFIKREIDQPSRIAITAGGRDDRIPDGAASGGSPFGAALVNAFVSTEGRARMSADFNDDGCVTHKELATWLLNEGRSDENTPREGTLGDSQRATILFCRIKDEPVPVAPVTNGEQLTRGTSQTLNFARVASGRQKADEARKLATAGVAVEAKGLTADAAPARLPKPGTSAPAAAPREAKVGRHLMTVDRSDAARESLLASIKRNPNDAQGHHKLSELEFRRERFEEAISHGEQAVRLAPKCAECRLTLGLANFRAGRPEQARAQLEAVLAITPKHPTAMQYLEIVREQLKDRARP